MEPGPPTKTPSDLNPARTKGKLLPITNLPDRFYPSKVKQVVEEVVKRNLADKEYHHQEAEKQAEQIVNEIRAQLKNLQIPSYKVVVQSVIGQVSGQGVRLASKCLWDVQNDNFTNFTYSNHSLFCTCVVFGIYYE